jgi:hypothetical protein
VGVVMLDVLAQYRREVVLSDAPDEDGRVVERDDLFGV